MQTLRMKSSLLGEFIEGLRPWGRVWAPVERGHGLFSLEVVDEDVAKARPEALRTVIPFKKLLLKPKFTMLRSEAGGVAIESADNDCGPQVFFGAHACDIHSLKILDLLYLSDYPDPYYRRNREQLAVIGYGCWPDERCFCESLNTSSANDGFDLFLTPLENAFQVVVGSSLETTSCAPTATSSSPRPAATRADTSNGCAKGKRHSHSISMLPDCRSFSI